MAVAPCVEADIPFPIDADFTDGEKAIVPGADIEAIPQGNYFLAKYFDFSGGLYTIKGIADTTGRWAIGFDASSGRVLFANAATLGTQEQLIYIPRGRQRIDVYLQCLVGPTARSYIAFSLNKNGVVEYASAAEGWVYDTEAILDEDVPVLADERLTYEVFPILPNWASGILERVEWETEIFTSETDVEQRRSLRRYPRRSIEGAFLRVGPERSRIDFFINSQGRKKILVPLWFEQYTLPVAFDPITPTITFPLNSLGWREFQLDNLVIFIGKSPDKFDIGTIVDITDDTITLVMEGTPSTWPAGSRVIPLRVARLDDNVSIENLTDWAGRTSIRFNLDDPFTQFHDFDVPSPDVFPFNPEWAAPVEYRYSRLDFLFDTAHGKAEVQDVGNKARVGMRFTLRLFNREQMYYMREYLATHRGRCVRFLCPQFTHDIHVVTDITGTSIEAKKTGFSEYFKAPEEHRFMLWVQTRDGEPPFELDIASCTETSPGIETFIVTNFLGDLPVLNILRVSFLMYVRFDQDGFEFTHYVDDSRAVELPLVMRTIDGGNWNFTWPDDPDDGDTPEPPPDG